MAPRNSGIFYERNFEFATTGISLIASPNIPRPKLDIVRDIAIQSVPRLDGFVAAYAGDNCDVVESNVFLELAYNGSLQVISALKSCAETGSPTVHDVAFSGGYNPFTEAASDPQYFWREVADNKSIYASLPISDFSMGGFVGNDDPGKGPTDSTFARSTTGSLVAFNDETGKLWVVRNGTDKAPILLETGITDPTHFDIIHLADDVYIYTKVVGPPLTGEIEVFAFEYRRLGNQVRKLKTPPFVVDYEKVQDVALAPVASGFILFALHSDTGGPSQTWTMQPYLIKNTAVGPVAIASLEARFGQNPTPFNLTDLDSVSVEAVRVGDCDLNVVMGGLYEDAAHNQHLKIEGGTFKGLWGSD